MGAKPDFSGWATKANLRCSDGRTITSDAFKDQDSTRVPLVWNHGHRDPENVLGYAILQHRNEGIWCEGYFNESDKALNAKEAVRHGDINAMSIFANKLVEKSKTVLHGVIREVSLVLAGANPGALIENISIAHSDGSYEELEDAAEIYTGLEFEHSALEEPEAEAETEQKEEIVPDEVQHADDSEKTVQDVLSTFNEEQKTVLFYLVGQAKAGDMAAHADTDEAPSEEYINTIFHSMTSEQQDILQALIGFALENNEAAHADTDTDAAPADDTDTAEAVTDSAAHSDSEEGTTMAHNVFEQNDSAEGTAPSGSKLTHAQEQEIFAKALRHGGTNSLKELVEDYIADNQGTLAHGINNIGLLFPDAKNITQTPNWLSRRTAWVAKVLDGTRHVPFSRIKSQDANLTLDAARAKGYVKGNLKKEEFFGLSQRVTTPQTIYKKQVLDRDDIIDITDFDVVVWLKGEMRLMLDEEIARAILLGDGREAGDPDRINPTNIRPIATDDDYYATKVYANIDDPSSTMEEVIDLLTLNRRYYRGSGNPVFFTSETFLAKALMVKDGVGRRVYNTPADVATQLRVSEIITVEILDEPTTNVVGILVNLADYTVGSDKGGDITLFDDFDIDYNKNKYLIETRLSGALVKAKAAIVVLKTNKTDVVVDPVAPSFNATNHQVTVATTTGVTYKNKATNATLTTGSPVQLAPGDELVVVAVPAAGYYLASTMGDEFNYTYEKGRVASSLY